jgi:hypothetical protein
MERGERARRVREIRQRVDRLDEAGGAYAISISEAKLLCNEIDYLKSQVDMLRRPYEKEPSDA